MARRAVRAAQSGAIVRNLRTLSIPVPPLNAAGTPQRGVPTFAREVSDWRQIPPALRGRGHRSAMSLPRPFGDAPVPDSALRGDLDRVVMKAIRKERAERYQSAAAFSEDLRRYLAGEPVSAAPPTLAYLAGKFVRRHRASVAAAAVVVLALLAGLIVSLEQVRRTNRALAGETQARAEATFTLSDMYMYARSGLTAAENGDATRAALWFANAAIIGARDPDRAEANLLRATSWRLEARTAVRAFDTGFDHLHGLNWNPRHPAMIVQAENDLAAQVWNLETEEQWPPVAELKLARAAWNSSGDKLAVLLNEPPPRRLPEAPEARPRLIKDDSPYHR